jgi:hypothetical protein
LVVDYVLLAEHLKFYHSGKINAIKARDLSYFGTAREIRAAVNLARKDGYMICSETVGYYFAVHPEDILETVNRLESAAHEQLLIVEALRSSMSNHDV